MVVPNRHVSSLERLNDGERLDILKLLDRSLSILRKVFHPEGFNVGMNLGSAGGAGVPGHVHIHVVPRWFGDTNFMPTIGRTKVISDSLKGSYEALRRSLGI
jgi:ATP adenylyltransferase